MPLVRFAVQGALLVPLLVPGEPLRLETLVAEALRSNPEILAARERWEAARQRPSRASSLPDPVVSFGYASVGRPWPLAGLGRYPTANAGLMFMQEFPAPGKLRLEGAMAEEEAAAEFHQYQAVALSVVARLKQAYHRLQGAHAAADALLRNRELLDKLVAVAQARYAAGLSTTQDVLRAQTEISLLEVRRVRLLEEQNSRRAEINSLLARPYDAALEGSLTPQYSLDATLAPLPSLHELLRSAERNSPLLACEQRQIARSELALNAARKDFYPDFALSAGYFSMGSMGSMYMFRADITLPLYAARKQRPALALGLGQLRSARRTYEAEALTLRARIQEAYLSAEATRQRANLYRTTVIPQAGLALEAAFAAYETGAADFTSVLSNFSALLGYEADYYQEVTSYYLALTRLEELTGEVLLR